MCWPTRRWDRILNFYPYSALTPCQYNDTFNMKKPLGYYRSPIDRTASYYTYICASQSICLFRSEIYSLNEPDPDICVFICIQFFFFRFPGQCTVCLLILSNQINNWHLQVKNITKLPVLEIIFLYSQDICPFKSSFWSAILQTKTRQNLLTDNTLKEITQDVLVRC